MLDLLLMVFLAIFAVAIGFIVVSCTTGAKHSLRLGLIEGTIAGAILAIRPYLDGDHLSLAILFAGCLVGSVIASLLDNDQPLKRFFRKSIGLSIKIPQGKGDK